MNSQLIANVVRSRKDDEATVWDRLYAFWFRRLVYTQIWEDPVADLAALRLPIGSTIVTLSSGGCNALSYLMAQPAQVYAVDLNEAHLALIKLKLAGSARLFRLFGFLAVLRCCRLAGQLRALSRAVAATAGCAGAHLLGQAQHRRPPAPRLLYANGFYRHGMLGRFIGLPILRQSWPGIDPAIALERRAGRAGAHRSARPSGSRVPFTAGRD